MTLRPLDPMNLAQPNPREVGLAGRLLLIAVTLLATGIAITLTFMKLTGQISNLAGCSGDGGCNELLSGRWASWLTVPVSLWALLIYLPLLGLAISGLNTPKKRLLAFVATAILVTAAGWFIGLQVVVEQKFCKWCLTMHVCGTIAFMYTTIRVFKCGDPLRSVLVPGIATTVIAMTLLIAGQTLGPQPASHEITEEDLLAAGDGDPMGLPEPAENDPPESSTDPTEVASTDQPPTEPPVENEPESQGDILTPTPISADELPPSGDVGSDTERTESSSAAVGSLLPENNHRQSFAAPFPVPDQAESGVVVGYFGGGIRLQMEVVPHVGKLTASHRLLKYYDYTCPACGRMHRDLKELQSRHPDEVALLLIPCPMFHRCNRHVEKRDATTSSHRYACQLAGYAMAVWRAKPEAFESFHDQMFELQGRVTPKSAKLIAASLVGEKELEQAMRDPFVALMIRHSTTVYGKLKKKNPRMPKLLLGGRQVLHGVATDTPAFIKAVEETLGLD